MQLKIREKIFLMRDRNAGASLKKLPLDPDREGMMVLLEDESVEKRKEKREVRTMAVERKWLLMGLAVMMVFAGCARGKELERVNREQASTIVTLNNDIARLDAELASLKGAKEELDKTKADLEKKLRAELSGGDVMLSMQDRGLVVTVLDKVLFDSGKSNIKETAEGTLGKVSEILNRDSKDHVVYVEGHTDNEPIRYSGWKSNWELSTTRATEVLHHLSDLGGVNPRRLVASGYGEYHPVNSNDTPEGRDKNRRVDIVISPRKITDRKVEEGSVAGISGAVGTEGVIK